MLEDIAVRRRGAQSQRRTRICAPAARGGLNPRIYGHASERSLLDQANSAALLTNCGAKKSGAGKRCPRARCGPLLRAVLVQFAQNPASNVCDVALAPPLINVCALCAIAQFSALSGPRCLQVRPSPWILRRSPGPPSGRAVPHAHRLHRPRPRAAHSSVRTAANTVKGVNSQCGCRKLL